MKLSDFELDIMALFWNESALTAPEVYSKLGEPRGVTYSTIKSLIDRLESKGALTRTELRGRTIHYKSAIRQEKVRRPLVKSFLDRVYGSDLRPLFAQLFSGRPLSDDETTYLRELLDKKGNKP